MLDWIKFWHLYIKCNKAIEICLDLSFSTFTLMEHGSNLSSMHVFDWPSMSFCDLPVKVAEVHGRVLELRDMPTCVNWSTFSWHMLPWSIPYEVWLYAIICDQDICVTVIFSEKQYFANLDSCPSLMIFIIISWWFWLGFDQRYPMSDSPHPECLARKS